MNIIKLTKELYHRVIAQLSGAMVRARESKLVHLPKKIKGANCGNCNYWKNTNDSRFGYCFKPDVSVFVTKKQICNNWVVDGATNVWDNKKPDMIGDFRDYPPNINGNIEMDNLGGVLYIDRAEIARASRAGMKTLPEETIGTACKNCKFSQSPGWCNNKKVDQPIEEHDLCKHWEEPGTIFVKDE